MKRLFFWLGTVLSIALAVYFVRFAENAIAQYRLGPLMTTDLMLATIAAALLYALCIPISGWAWHVLLRGMGIHWHPGKLAAIMGVTQLAKYVPGNVGQHISRTALALAKGVPVGAYAGSVLIETVLAMFAGLFVGAAFSLISPVPVSSLIVEYQFALSLMAGALMLFALVLPWVFRAFNNFFRDKPFGGKWQLLGMTSPGYGAVCPAFAGYCVNYLVIGLGLWLISVAVDVHITADYFYLTAVFALSWLIGFLTPGAPAGFGVREGVMALMLSSVGQNDAVLIVIAAMRVATIAGDGLVFIVAALYMRLKTVVSNS